MAGSKDKSPEAWSREAQDAAEAAAPRLEPVPAEPVPFLDRRVGYVTARWAVVVGAAFAGALVGIIVGVEIDRRTDDLGSGLLPVPLAAIGFLLGGAVALVVVLFELAHVRRHRLVEPNEPVTPSGR